ncbi:response regulator [Nevskia soli]|uniref:response regulator n=1 Tax=Nevskia soli TaxID=418856 RepID=UPI0004A76086|nr:response regulator [Nevskia soli]
MNTNSIPSGRILVVDDEPAIRRLLRSTLGVQDYTVLEAASVAQALEVLAREKVDLIILDLGLPDGDGFEVIRKLRPDSQVPIIVLSSRDDESGKVQALDAGADDYVTKPFGVEELVARIRAALRHRVQAQGGKPVFQSEGLTVDLVHRRITRDGNEVKLSPKEYDILQQLVIHAGKVLTHRHLLREVWGSENDDDVAYLRVYIRQLRGKLETDPAQPTLILTEPGVGYRLRVS